FTLNITVIPHSLSRSTDVLVGSKGNQCVLLRGTVLPAEPGVLVTHKIKGMSTEWEEVLWFTPEHLPNDEQLKKFIDGCVNKMMKELTDGVLSDVSATGLK